MRVLLTGPTGALGTHIRALLQRQTDLAEVRLLCRRPLTLTGVETQCLGDLTRPGTLEGCCQGIDAVIACAGASMSLGNLQNRTSFLQVDWEGNRHLLRQAQKENTSKFVYVSLLGGPDLRHTEYADAHERLVDTLAESGHPYTVVRPTGYFSFFRTVYEQAAKGQAAVIGDGSAKTNPVHDADVADTVWTAVHSAQREISVGGPEVFTRRQIAELARQAAGVHGTIRTIPPGMARALCGPLGWINPRLAGLLRFGVEVSLTDCIAPPMGRRSLRDYFQSLRANPVR